LQDSPRKSWGSNQKWHFLASAHVALCCALAIAADHTIDETNARKFCLSFRNATQMKYAYEDLSPDQFESLVVLLCQRVLGISVQGFAKGPDGGRDAKFIGTAELHPSKASPWSGMPKH
jgi:hypothetical protein